MEKNFYTLSAFTPLGEVAPMSRYQGKVILVVNTATKCGLAPQFEGLEHLYQKYRDKGLVVLGFPSDQFSQEPEADETMTSTCKVNFGVTFPLFRKIHVNGKTTDPVFVFLKKKLRGIFGGRILWNFTKFLVDAEGNPVKRFAPTVKPSAIGKHIEGLLK